MEEYLGEEVEEAVGEEVDEYNEEISEDTEDIEETESGNGHIVDEEVEEEVEGAQEEEIVNEEDNETIIINERPEKQGKVVYTKIYFEALHDGQTTKWVRFKSYTLEGNEEDRLQEEYLAISLVDETPPIGTVEYSETRPTNQNVFVTLIMSDTQSGIVKCEKSYDGINYIDTGSTSKYTEEFEENGVVYFRITNGAGMTSIVEARV